jgi:hypothetical protein
VRAGAVSEVPAQSGHFFTTAPASPMQWWGGVKGTITSRDVLLHSFTILRLWGPGFYVRCIRAIASGKSCTFLDVLASGR